jgi:hypothetical protein
LQEAGLALFEQPATGFAERLKSDAADRMRLVRPGQGRGVEDRPKPPAAMMLPLKIFRSCSAETGACPSAISMLPFTRGSMMWR